MSKPEAVIFDMDGVLIDSEPIHYEIERKLFDRLDIVVDEGLHRSYLGASSRFMYADLKSRFDLQQTVCELMDMDELFRCEYFKRLDKIILNNGVINLLHEIKASGLKLAVATSSSPEIVRILLDKCGISAIFDTIVTTSDAGKSKPAPDVYLLAAKRIGVSPANCIVFEDSPNGLSSAKSAGMYCIVIQSDHTIIQGLTNADYLIRSFTEVTLGQLFKFFSFTQTMESEDKKFI